jgi:uncharacterized protein YqfA (UPF0365 family)
MLFAQRSELVVVVLLALVFLSLLLLALLLFAGVAAPWVRALTSGVPLSILEVLSMRLRRTNVNAVLDAMVLARQAGVFVTRVEMERAYLQRVDLEKITLAVIEAKRRGSEMTVQELVDADLAGRLAEKLKQ